MRPAPPPPPELGRAPLLDLDPELGASLPEEERARAAGLVVQTLLVEPGPWSGTDPGGFAMLVADGMLVRETAVGGRLLPQVLGAGDVLETWPPERAPLLLEHRNEVRCQK